MSPGSRPVRHVDLITRLAVAAIAGGAALYVLRFVATGGEIGHRFLVLNTVLAAIPLVAAVALVKKRRRRLEAIALGLVWLAFLPNAPYLVTDLKHLPEPGGAIYWFDLVLISTFGMIGLLLGSASIYLVHDAARGRGGIGRGWLLVAAIIPLVGIGVSLGRFARWHTWDLLLAPQLILGDVLGGVIDPLGHQKELAVAIAMAWLVAGAYLVFFALIEARPGSGAAGAIHRHPEPPTHGRGVGSSQWSSHDDSGR